MITKQDEKIVCRDCGKLLLTKEDPDTKNQDLIDGKLLKYQDGDKDIYAYKCDECFAKDPSLKNYQKCEVYSRVVGYIRPVQQWHQGKQEEYVERKEFKIDKE